MRESTDRRFLLRPGNERVEEELRVWLFGGLELPGPPLSWVEARYDHSVCQLPQGNHRVQSLTKRMRKRATSRLSRYTRLLRVM